MATEDQQGAPSVVDRYYTRWYKTGRQCRRYQEKIYVLIATK